MLTISLVAGKGGSGKTTTATALAVAAAAAGNRTLLLDLDPQESARRWGRARGEAAPLVTVEASDATKLPDRLRTARRSYDVTVIDTPPTASATARAAATAAGQAGGLVVVPVRPSPHDLRTVRETLDLVRATKAPFLLVVTQGSARTRLTLETVEALSSLGPLGPLLSRLDVYAASAADGLTPLDAEPRGRAAAEIRTLWAQIAGRLVDKTT